MKNQNQHSDFKFFRDYYTGKISKEEKEKFKKDLENDPFAQEAFEGFSTLENDFARISVIENANISFKKKVGIEKETKTIPLKLVFSVAASLFILIGSYFIVQNNSLDNTFSENKTSKIETTKEQNDRKSKAVENDILILHSDSIYDTLNKSKEEEILVFDDEIEDKNNDFKNIEMEIKEKKESIDLSNAISEQSISKETEDRTDVLIGAVETPSVETSIAFTDDKETLTKSNTSDNNTDRYMMNTIIYDDEELTEANKSELNISEYKKGIAAYNQSDFNKAIKFFNKSILNNKSVNSSYYFIAMSYFNQNKASKAINYFDKVINTSSSFKDKAKWYKALSLINKGQKSQAKILLQEIANSSSFFKFNAENRLKTL